MTMTVAMAWVLSARFEVDDTERAHAIITHSESQWQFGIQDVGSVTSTFMRPRWIEPPAKQGIRWFASQSGLATQNGFVPSWTRAAHAPDPSLRESLYAQKGYVRIELASGWPMRSLMWFADTTDDQGRNGEPTPAWSIGLEPRSLYGGQAKQCRALPLRPIWPGFVVDTLAFAAAPWLLICAPRFFRRRSIPAPTIVTSPNA